MLPLFGGSPGVWATALFFFSAILFIGYAYAHASATWLGARRGSVVHLGLALVLVVASIAAPTDVQPIAGQTWPEAIKVLVALILLAGPPALLLASTTPLLSSWFAGRSSDVWWLYAVSNAASLIALLAYPFVIEPFLPLSVQRLTIQAGLVVFVGLLAAIVMTLRRESAPSSPAEETAKPQPKKAQPKKSTPKEAEQDRQLTWRRQLGWLAAAFIPAGLLTATTTFLTTDLVSAPLLWVGPLAIYLGSFVVAFSERGRRLLAPINLLVPAAITLLWLPFVNPAVWSALPLVITILLSLAIVAVALHGRLALDRPDQSQLTRFYLIISLAGVLATALVGVAAPLLLRDIYEYPLLLIGAVVVLALVRSPDTRWIPNVSDRSEYRALAVRAVAFLAASAMLVITSGGLGAVIALVSFGLLVVGLSATPRLLAVATPIALVIAVLYFAAFQGTQQLFIGRSFFGVSEVRSAGNVHALYSGTTLHGIQYMDDASKPTTYYVVAGGLGDAFSDLRARLPAAGIGVVGLGTGTIAAYTQRGDSLTFFEIDPLVVKLAYDSTLFSFLRESAVAPTTVLGDGRLSIANRPSASLDLLILDAFSSDSVPPHLLTSEAIETYMRSLRPGGVLMFNLSNRFYDLPRVIGPTAARLGLDALRRDYSPDRAAEENEAATASTWVVVGRPEDTARFVAKGWAPLPKDGPVLTDDYPDITRVLRLLP